MGILNVRVQRGGYMVLGGIVLASLGGGALLLRRSWERREGAPADPNGAGVPSSASAPRGPADATQPAAAVTAALQAWRAAIRGRDSEAVLSLDRTFRERPAAYAAALADSAQHDPDERVRAFSTRVLGKLKDPGNAALFEVLLDDASVFVRQNAAWAIGELAEDGPGDLSSGTAASRLRRVEIDDPAPEVRAAAGAALTNLKRRR
jgi:HEAT repeat protein